MKIIKKKNKWCISKAKGSVIFMWTKYTEGYKDTIVAETKRMRGDRVAKSESKELFSSEWSKL